MDANEQPSPIEGMPNFSPDILVSTLRIATTYEYPALRVFAMRGLEKATMNIARRIEIAQEFDLQSWKVSAYEELHKREEPVTEEEASVLGISEFVEVAKIREQVQWMRGKELSCYERNPREADEQQNALETSCPYSSEANSTPSASSKYRILYTLGDQVETVIADKGKIDRVGESHGYLPRA